MKRRVVILAVVLLGCTAPVWAQGCAMCYSSAQATSQEGQRAIHKGVMVLLIPPMGFMTLGIWMAQRYARKRDLERANEDSVHSSSHLITG
jgi:ABC-type nickel/cobalt efflux system permease component RcnA